MDDPPEKPGPVVNHKMPPEVVPYQNPDRTCRQKELGRLILQDDPFEHMLRNYASDFDLGVSTDAVQSIIKDGALYAVNRFGCFPSKVLQGQLTMYGL